MGQSVFVWLVIFDNLTNVPEKQTYICTWDELMNTLPGQPEPVAIIRIDYHE